jgi:hypothetical protein
MQNKIKLGSKMDKWAKMKNKKKNEWPEKIQQGYS